MPEAPVEPARDHDRRRLLRGAATLAALGGPLALIARPALAAQTVSGLTLINADTNQPISGFDPLRSGAVLDLSKLPTRNLNIRANTSPATVGSVRFGLDSTSSYRTETVPPYAIAGDTSGNYTAWTPSVGSHKVTATPYSGAGGTGSAGTPLTVSFSVEDGSTDSAPPPPSTSGNTSLAYGGQYLGCPSYGGGKANNGFWVKHAYRFVAEHSGAIKNVRWENRTGPGYSVANGGSVQISIQTDSGGRPSGQKIGMTGVYANAATLGLYPVYTFSAQPQLVYGTTYHVVFEQLASDQGMTSVNDLADWVAPPDGLSIFPLEKSTLASIRWQNNAWKVMPGQIPIFELTYTDGIAKGQPWMGGGRPDQQSIAGGNMARQSFSIGGSATTVHGISFALYRTGSVGPLTVRITDASNKVLFQTSVDGDQVSSSSSGDTSPLHWLYVPTSPTTLAAGGTYYVSFQAGAGGGLWALPLTNGYFYGFRSSCCTSLSRSAQYSTSGGASWGWWPRAGGGASSWRDLPVFLKTFA